LETTTLIIGIIVSAVISGIFSESIVQGIGKLLSKIDLPQKADIEGVWDVEFSMREGKKVICFRETIKVVKRLGIIYGYNIPDLNNHALLKTLEHNKPLRIRASLIDNRYITGTWFHPDRKSRFHGSFQLLLGLSGDKMNGLWAGYRESTNSIDSGSWKWVQRA
jgi:hypothetical protein